MFVTYLTDISKPDNVKIMPIREIYNEIISDKLTSETNSLRLYKRLEKEARTEESKLSNKTLYDKAKNRLPNAVFAGEFSRRDSKSCTLYWHNVILDIDHITKEKDLVLIKEYFKKDLSTVLIFVSPSGEGLKVVQNVNYNDEEKIKFHKLAFSYLAKVHNKFLKKYNCEVDKSGSNIDRTCYLCRDEKAYFNDNVLPRVVEIEEIKPDKVTSTYNDYYTTFSGSSHENRPVMDRIVSYIEEHNIDLTSSYNNWLSIMWALKNTFSPQDGLNYFIALSKNYVNFNLEEVKKKWESNETDERRSKVTIGTIIYLAKQYGFKIGKNFVSRDALLNSLIEELHSHNIKIRFEMDSQRLQYLKNGSWEPFSDADEADIRIRIFKGGISKGDIIDFLVTIAPKISSHEIFLKSIPVWDKEDRFEALTNTLEYSDETPQDIELKKIFLKKWCVALIAGLHNNGRNNLMNENILILTGKQYAGKTRWCNSLLPKEYSEYFLTKNITLKDKDDLMLLTTKFIIFMDEGLSLRRNDIKEMKAISSTPTFTQRKAYGRQNENYIRYASFISATNDEEILSDDTGNRRYWVIKVDKIKFNHSIDMWQLWAQALELFKGGFQYWISDEELQLINDHNKTFEIENPIEEYVHRFIKKDNTGRMTATQIYEYIVKMLKEDKTYSIPQNLSVYSVGRVLKKMGFVKKMCREKDSFKGYYNAAVKGGDYDVEVDTTGVNLEKLFN